MSESKRTRFLVGVDESVTVSYWDAWLDDRLTRTFFVGKCDGEGYVREWTNNGNQVCERLSTLGSTLRASRKTLPAVIRREYRAMRRQERTERDRA